MKKEIKKKMDGKPYDMSLVGVEAKLVYEAVNQGIDSHLEACFIPERGDSYDVVGHRLNCAVSVDSLPVLLRRLVETGNDDAMMLVGDILDTLGFDNGTEKAFELAL